MPQTTRKTIHPLKLLIFSLLPLAVLGGALELILFIVKFEYNRTPRYLRFGYRQGVLSDDALAVLPKHLRDDRPVFRPAEQVFWEPIPGRYRYNQDGVIGDRTSVVAWNEALRIVAIGDSCTMQGEPSYPEIVRDSMAQSMNRPVKVANLAVAGYTSHQGVALVQSKVVSLKPDVVLIAFGWNDHQVALHYSDHQQRQDSPVTDKLMDKLRWFRSVQLASYLKINLQRKAFNLPGTEKQLSLVKYRVPLERFKENIAKMIDMVNDRGALAVIMTQPSALRFGIPDYYTATPLIADATTMDTLHESYNQTLREIAATKRVLLVDAADFFYTKDFEAWMMSDRIHFTKTGLDVLGKLISTAILQQRKRESGVTKS